MVPEVAELETKTRLWLKAVFNLVQKQMLTPEDALLRLAEKLGADATRGLNLTQEDFEKTYEEFLDAAIAAQATTGEVAPVTSNPPKTTTQGNGKAYTYTPANTTYYSNTCVHHGDPIFKVGDRSVYGAKESTVRIPCDVVMDASGFYKPGSFVKFGPAKYTALNAHVFIPKEVLTFDWPDATAPKVPFKFWQDLWELLPETATIVCCCMGGHGRTGTMAAALMLAATNWTANQVKQFIWKNYCDKAIETVSQEQYLDLMVAERDGTPLPATKAGLNVPLLQEKGQSALAWDSI